MKTVTYKCDCCGEKIEGMYGPLFVTIRSPTEPQLNQDYDLCSFVCAEAVLRSEGRVTQQERSVPVPRSP